MASDEILTTEVVFIFAVYKYNTPWLVIFYESDWSKAVDFMNS